MAVATVGAIEVGDLTGNHLGLLWHLPEGGHRVRVYTGLYRCSEPAPAVGEHVDFVID